MNQYSQAQVKPYSQKFLRKETSNSNTFLKECTYQVDLTQLYKIESTCYNHEAMPYCPVLIKIASPIQTKFYSESENHYLLQVWNEDNDKIYERPLKKPVKSWNIYFKYLIYKPQAPDLNHEYIHLVNLENSNSTVLINDIFEDKMERFFAYSDSVFMLASTSQIKLFPLIDDVETGEDIKMTPPLEEVATISKEDLKDMRIHGLFINKKDQKNIIVALETEENQIDFSSLTIITKPGMANGDEFAYKFDQISEIVPRKDVKFDNIKKLVVCFNKIGQAYSVALRNSGNADFYFMMTRVASYEQKVNQGQSDKFEDGVEDVDAPPSHIVEEESEAAKPKASVDYSKPITDVACSFDETYIQFGDGKKSTIWSIANTLQARVSIEEADILENYKFDIIFYQKIKNHCKLFSCFVFVKTYIFVSHGKYLSLFNVLRQKWLDHMEFDEEIVQIFRSEDGMQGFDICVLLSNGQIEIINENKESYEDGTVGRYAIDKSFSYQIDGEFIQHDQDRDDNRFTFIMSKRDTGDIVFSCFYQRQLFNLSSKIQGLNENTNFVFLFAETDETRFAIQEENGITMYEITMPEVEEEEDSNEEEEGDKIKVKKEPVVPEIKEIWRIDGLDSLREDSYNPGLPPNEQKRHFDRELHSAISILDRNDKIKFKGCKKEDEFARINEHFFFVDEYHIYKIDKKSKTVYVFENQNITGLFLSDNNYLYTLCHKRTDKNISSGFRLYDIWNCISTGQDLSYQLSRVQVGCQSLIDLSAKNQRFVFQSSFDKIEVLPVLHRNTNYFMGMGEREDYLATRIIQDKFIALNKKNQLTTWNVLNGKVREEYDLKDNENPNQDYSNFKIFAYNRDHMVFPREWFSKILLMSKDPITEVIDDNTFFNPADISTSVKNQLAFSKKTAKSYHEFRLIEIESETEVKEVASFIYPFWKGQRQFIYFSENGEYMFERLFYDRFLIYRSIPLNDKERPSRVRWELVRRITNLPSEFLKNTQHPFYMAPDFMQYLDIDQQKDIFIIRDTITQRVSHEIPKWLMNCIDENITEVVHRFRWHDNKTIRVINSEGIERIIRLDETFSEVQFHAIPLYMSYWCTQNHYYFDKPAVEQDNVLERLKRKYQAYKSATLLENKESPSDLYAELISVDYLILQEINENEEDDTPLDRYVIDQSFTFLHWNLIEQLQKGTLQVNQINLEQLKCLIYNIFPGGDTILHKLKDNGGVMEKIYQQCHYYSDEEKKLKARHHLPFVRNFDKQTPMDLLKIKEDRRNMDKMLLNLSPYWLDHHSREIKHLFGYFISAQLPSLNTYLKSRVVQTKDLKCIDKGIIQEDGVAPGISTSSFWMSEQERESIIKTGDIEQEVRVELIDVASLHTYTFLNEGNENLFDALANCGDYELFEQLAIKKIIEYKWPLTKEFTIKRLLLPYLMFMSTYLVYTNWLYQIRNEDVLYEYLNYGFIGVLGFFCWYFFILEMKQLKNEGLDYLKSVWNYLDLIPPFTLAIFLPLEVLGYFNYSDEANLFIAEQRMRSLFGQTVEDPTINIRTIEGVLQSVLSLILWLKLLYFLRIFKSTGYYIRTIVEVIKDMKYFLFMLMLTFLAFGDSMRQISTSNTEKQDFIGGTFLTSIAFIYRMVLGDFDTNSFGEVAVGYVWILFVLCTVLNMIIMMNLLIAIISESFANVTSVSEQASYREMADIIYENTYLIPDDRKVSQCPENKYLIVATDKQQELEGQLSFEDQVEQVIEKIGDRTRQAQGKLQDQMVESQLKGEELLASKQRDINRQRDEMFQLIETIHKTVHG